MSLGTSKLHHYAYPFLPPLALAAGYGPAWLASTLRHWFERALNAISSRTARLRVKPVVGAALVALGSVALVVSAATLVFGSIRWRVSGVTIFRNSDLLRPLFVAIILMVLAGRPKLAAHVAVVALVVSFLPVGAYRRTMTMLPQYEHPLRTARECLADVRRREQAAGRRVRSLYAVAENRWFLHSYYYYLRHFGWRRAIDVDDQALRAALGPAPRPVLITDADYLAFRARQQFDGTSVGIQRLKYALLLMPGPYAVCGQEPSRHVGVQ
jgi:hypothetical protein